jgi:hypothetical protein
MKMKRYKIAIRDTVYMDMENISKFILSKHRQDTSDKYLRGLYEDILSLEYLAGVLPYSQRETVKKIHPKGKRLLSKNKHWNIIFHISGDYAIVDRIIASSLIK